MRFEINQVQPGLWIRAMANQLGITSYNDCVNETLILPEQYGEGILMGFQFNSGIGLLVMNGTLQEDWEIVIQQDTPALQFNFCVKGEIRHFLKSNEIQYQLMSLLSTITASPATKTETFLLPAHTELIFSHLIVDRATYLNQIDCLVGEMPEALAVALSDIKAEKSFFYQGYYSLSIAETIRKIIQDKNEGIVKSTLIEGKTLELLSKQIKQFKDDSQLPQKQVILRESDLIKIESARDILIKNLKSAPTIEELARQVGVNRQKLKSGFKLLYDSTINSYLREERLETASLLLLSGKSVVEASNTVGYINQSHFTRRFKEKYNVLPKEYLKTIHAKLKNVG